MCNRKWILYNNQWWPVRWLDWEEAPKQFPKSNLHQKKIMVTVWWSVAHLIHYSILNTSETITSEKYAQQISEMHWKLQCQHLVLVNRIDQILPHNKAQPHDSQHFKLGYKVLPHLPYSSDLSPTDYHFFKCLNKCYQGKCFHNLGGIKCSPRIHWILKHGFFYGTGINKLFLMCKNVLIIMVPILINKGVFEPSCNDLKFMVQNYSYLFH